MFQQRTPLIVIGGGGHNGDVHSLQLIYPGVVDLREDQLIVQTNGVIAAAIKRFGHKDVRYIGALENAAAALRDYVRPGDLVLTLGAGTVSRVSDQLLELLRQRSEAKSV